MSETIPVADAEVDVLKTPFVMHVNLWMGVVAIIFAPLVAAVPFLLFGDDSFSDLYPLMGSVVIVTTFNTVAWRQVFVIEPDSVRTKGWFNITRRRYPIAGLSDLVIDGKTLRRRSDRKKLYKLDRIECNAQDLQTLRNSIPTD